MQQLLLLNSHQSNGAAGTSTGWAQGVSAASGAGQSGTNAGKEPGGFLAALKAVRQSLGREGALNNATLSNAASARAFQITGAATDQGQNLTSHGLHSGIFLPPGASANWLQQLSGVELELDGSQWGSFQAKLVGEQPGEGLFQALSSQLSSYLRQADVQQALAEQGFGSDFVAQLQTQLSALVQEMSATGAQMSGQGYAAALMEVSGLDQSALGQLQSKLASLDPASVSGQAAPIMQTLNQAMHALSGLANGVSTVNPGVANSAEMAHDTGVLNAFQAIRSMQQDGRPGQSLSAQALTNSAGAEASGVQGPVKNNAFVNVSTEGGATSYFQQQSQSQMMANAQGLGLTHASAESDAQFKMTMETALSSGLSPDLSTEGADEALTRVSDTASNRTGNSTQTASATRPYATTVSTPVGDPEWAEKMNEKVLWMSSRGIQSAQIHLNPAELGPVEVKVSVQNEQTVVQFQVHNTSVRELLESNVHRLREMMDSGGVNLAQVDVEDGSAGQQEFAGLWGEQGGDAQQGQGHSGDAEDESGAEQSITRLQSDLDDLSIIDDYA